MMQVYALDPRISECSTRRTLLPGRCLLALDPIDIMRRRSTAILDIPYQNLPVARRSANQ